MEDRARQRNRPHCILGWAMVSIPRNDGLRRFLLRRTLLIVQVEHPKWWGLTPFRYLAQFNDDCSNTLEEVADVWNLSIASLGYEENNPAAKSSKRLPPEVRKITDEDLRWIAKHP